LWTNERDPVGESFSTHMHVQETSSQTCGATHGPAQQLGLAQLQILLNSLHSCTRPVSSMQSALDSQRLVHFFVMLPHVNP
jgi:hypothetical protein